MILWFESRLVARIICLWVCAYVDGEEAVGDLVADLDYDADDQRRIEVLEVLDMEVSSPSLNLILIIGD